MPDLFLWNPHAPVDRFLGMQQRKKPGDDRPKLSTLNVELPDDLFLELRLASVHRRAKREEPWNLKDITTEALRDWLRKNKR